MSSHATLAVRYPREKATAIVNALLCRVSCYSLVQNLCCIISVKKILTKEPSP